MRFKICAFTRPIYAPTIKELTTKLTNDYLDTSVSVKYIKESGIVGVLFVDVLYNGECRGTYSGLLIDFNKLDTLAALSFDVESTLLAVSS